MIWDAATGTVIRSVDFGGMYRVSEWSANAEFVAGGWFSFDRIHEPTQIVSVATGELLLTFARTSIVWHPSENRFLIVVNPYDDCETDCKHEVQVWDVQ